ncbi:MAG: cobalt-precorrin-5B (C(1))-methyltransferase CbiD [Lachnospiraceae bacterium]|nr:cobalt-precorrin-5B (C(1))-methyltransferase CbiD [Lachnospiraceae bacterium]
MRFGFTTGSCAAAASKAAVHMLFFGGTKREITICTPKGIDYNAEILDIKKENNMVSCAVRKDGGDDPDVTTGALVYSTVRLYEYEALAVTEEEFKCDISDNNPSLRIIIKGGTGVGTVTKPGLDQPVGNAAINHVPREMITEVVTDVCKQADFHGILEVTISVPQGEEIAKKTFNERLGIVGGISIIGTSGIVEPMSTQAILDTIKLELNQRYVNGYDMVAITPGNYGLDFMKNAYGYDLDRSVKCSNFVGATIDMAREIGFKKVLLTGHIGKLIKVSGGIMNTHSKEGDCRMELMAAAAIMCGATSEVAKNILESVATEEGLNILDDAGILDETMMCVMDRIMNNLSRRATDDMAIECIMYSNDRGELAKSEGAEKWLILLVQEQGQQI